MGFSKYKYMHRCNDEGSKIFDCISVYITMYLRTECMPSTAASKSDGIS